MFIRAIGKRSIPAVLLMISVVGCGGEPSAPITPDAKIANPGDKETSGFDPSNPLGGGQKPAAKAKGGSK